MQYELLLIDIMSLYTMIQSKSNIKKAQFMWGL